jgi:vesicle-fusing ATPase
MEFSSPPLTVEKAKNIEQATSNYLYVSNSLFANFQTGTQKSGTSQEPIYVKLMGYVFILAAEKSLAENHMIISGVTRSQLKISHTMDHPVVNAFTGGEGNYLATSINLRIKAPRLKEKFEVKEKEIGQEFINKYRKHIVSLGQEIFFNYKGVDIVVTVTGIDTADNDDMNEFPYGMIFEETDWEIKSKSQLLRVQSKSMKSKNIFNKKFNFGDLGVGGMDEQIMVMFRRAFASRRLPAAILEQYNKNHVKGVLLYGPPGTGKTLIARQMAQCLQAKKPKIVNGKFLYFNNFRSRSPFKIRW